MGGTRLEVPTTEGELLPKNQKGKKSPSPSSPTFLSGSPIATHDTSHNSRASQGSNATLAALSAVYEEGRT